jgi:phenylalanyl-tRNA synthetase beta chain
MAGALVGTEIPAGEVRLHLEKLGFGWKAEGKRALVEVPSWRPDVRREADLIEEVARSHGYDAIPERQWNESGMSASRHPMQDTEARARGVLLGFGWDEAVTTSLVSAEEAGMSEWLGPDAPPWTVRNASSREEACLRRSVLPGLLRALARNLNRGAADVRLFEVGKVFSSRPGPLGSERVVLSAAATGARRGSHWSERPTPLDFYDIKGALEGIVEALGIDSCQAHCYHGEGFEEGAGLDYLLGGERCGVAGEIARSWRERYGIGEPVFGFSVDLSRFAPGRKEHRVFREPSRFPSVRRDLAFVVPETQTHEQVARAIRESGGDLVVQVRLFDVFSGGGLGSGRRSLAYAVTFQSMSRTLTDAEVDAAEETIVRHVAAALGATRRI